MPFSDVSRKPHCPQNPQTVLVKTVLRIPDAADDAALQIIRAVKRVDQPARRVIGHCVDREIPPCEIVGQ